MRNLKLLAVLCLWISFFHGVTAQTASVQQGCAPLEVVFTPPSGQTEFFWNFGTGATSILSNPTNTFIQSGTYEVTFSNTESGPVVGTVTINVYEKPSGTLSIDPTTGCTPLDVNFEASLTNNEALTINSIDWAFGDGNTDTDDEIVSHTYTDVGIFNVSLAINTNIPSCNTTINFDESIETSSIEGVNFLTNPFPATACDPPLVVSFVNFTPHQDDYTYAWDFGDGTTFDGPEPPPHVYNEVGHFQVVLEVTNSDGCIKSVTRDVNIGSILVETGIPDTVCVDQQIFPNSNAFSFEHQWLFDSPSISASVDPTTQITIIEFSEHGTFEIGLAVYPPDGCADTLYQTVFADDPIVDFESDPSYACSGPLTVEFQDNSPHAVDWLWTFPDGTTSSGSPTATTTLTYPDIDPYGEYGEQLYATSLVITNPSGCAAELILEDTIYRPDARFMPDVVNGCAPLSVTFYDSTSTREDIISWHYTFGDGNSFMSSDTGDVTHVFEDPGEYPVQLSIENAAGCVDTSYVVVIKVGRHIKIDFTADQTDICIGDTIRLMDITGNEDIDAWHFKTDAEIISHCYNDNDIYWIPTITGDSEVALTVEQNGCFTTHKKNNFIHVSGPKAEIAYNIDCEAPYTVMFRDSSQDVTTYHWDFGDGNTSDQNAPTHTYAQTGDYMVVLTATNETTGCDPSIDSMLVHITEIEANLTLPTLMCHGVDTVLYASLSQDVHEHCARGYQWHFDISGRPIETQTDSIHFAFPNTGHEVITLIVEDINGCKDTTSQSLDIYGVETDIIVAPEIACANGTVPYDLELTATGDTTLVSWEWDFGDETTGEGIAVQHIFETGTDLFYNVNALVTDVLGCEGEATVAITIYEPTADIIASVSPSQICVGEEITFSSSPFSELGSPLSLNWNFGQFGQSQDSVTTVLFDKAGEYEIVLNSTEISTGCPGTTTHDVSIQAFPTADFNTSVDGQDEVCYPAQIDFSNQSQTNHPTTYSWNFDNGNTASIDDPTIGFGKGTFKVQLIASTSYGCSDTTYQDLTLVGPEGDFIASPTTICVGEEVDFILTDAVDVGSYTWNFGDGTTTTDENPISHTYNNLPPNGSTVATLVLEAENGGCSIGIEKTINIDGIEVDFLLNGGDETVFCEDEIAFTTISTGTTTYDWNFGDGEQTNEENPIHSFVAGEYEVSLAVSNENSTCDGLVTKIITVVPPVTWTDIDTFICMGETHLPLQPIVPSNAMVSWDEDFPFTPESSTEYTVSIVDTVHNCYNNDYSYYVEVIGGDTRMEIPNVFSPNGDGMNDIFQLHASDDFYEFSEVTSFQIWDRWGNTIVDSSGEDIIWDGTYKGKPSPTDVYLYKITITQKCDGHSYDLEGEISILR